MSEGREKISLVQTAYNAIKNLILEGQICPGDQLSERYLSEYLNMSRTPVREAVRRLQADRIAEFREGQGTYLRRLTWKELQDIYVVRMGLGFKACQTSIGSFQGEEVKELQKEFHSLWQHYQSGAGLDLETFDALKRRLHDFIVAGSDNRYIRELMEQIDLSVCQSDALLARLPFASEERLRQYMEVTDCLADRNCERLRVIMEQHLQEAMRKLQQSWNQDDRILWW